MRGIGVRTSIADRPHRLRLQSPGTPTADARGNYVLTPIDLDPAYVFGHVAPASAGDLEAGTASTVFAQATHVVRIPYHSQVTTQTTIEFWTPSGVRQLTVIGASNPEERSAEQILLCSEVVR